MLLTDSYTSRSQGTAVAKHSILVQSNVAQVTQLLNFVTYNKNKRIILVSKRMLKRTRKEEPSSLIYQSIQEDEDPTEQGGSQFHQ